MATELGKANRYDAEIANAERWRLAIEKAGDVATAVLVVAASALPIWAVSRIVAPLAGKTTIADININIALTLSLSVGIVMSIAANAAQWVRGRGRRRELKRQRDRITQLEQQLGL